mmetsp:Transcript_6562/g.20806  ORF Transcript_6562/g.20806 Transcript_6562/m.20806 type:complete len:372 (+) Transcript_6562:857-1972(+)
MHPVRGDASGASIQLGRRRLWVHGDHQVVHRLRNSVLALEVDPRGPVAELLRVLAHHRRVKRGAEEAHLQPVRGARAGVLWQQVEQLHHVLRALIGQEVISFIQHEEPHTQRIQSALPRHGQHTSRSAHHHVAAGGQSGLLRARRAADEENGLQRWTGQVPPELVHARERLLRQVSGRLQDDGQRGPASARPLHRSHRPLCVRVQRHHPHRRRRPRDRHRARHPLRGWRVSDRVPRPAERAAHLSVAHGHRREHGAAEEGGRQVEGFAQVAAVAGEGHLTAVQVQKAADHVALAVGAAVVKELALVALLGRASVAHAMRVRAEIEGSGLGGPAHAADALVHHGGLEVVVAAPANAHRRTRTSPRKVGARLA